MTIKLISITSYVKALRNSSLKECSDVDYMGCLKSKLYHVEGNKVFFRTYLNDLEYFEYVFERSVGKIEYLYRTYGREA